MARAPSMRNLLLSKFITITSLPPLRLHLQSGGSLNMLPGNILAALEAFDGRCDEAGYLARELEERNGIEKTVDCLEAPGRPISQTLAIGSHNRIDGLMVFPNPATEQLNISCPNENLVKIRLLELTGQRIPQYEFSTATHEFSIPIKNLNPGIYFLEAIGESGNVEKVKIVVTH